MYIVIFTEKVHEQTVSGIMERGEVHIEVFDIKYVFDKSPVIF